MISFLRAHLHAAVLVSLTAFRLRRLERDSEFDLLLAKLREGKPFPDWAREPRAFTRLTGRLLRWLPPRGMGPCMKRSLILLHLWTRCGLDPELHLGVRRGREVPFQAHAWLTANLQNGGRIATGDSGYEASFTFWSGESLDPSHSDSP